MAVLGGLFSWNLAMASTTATSCDATSAASTELIGVRTTLTSANLYWTERTHDGTRIFCYGIGSPDKCADVSSRLSGVNNQAVTGLAPRTKYAYKFYGVWNGKTKSPFTGTFTTDSSGCGNTIIIEVEVKGTVLSESGDSLENVRAYLSTLLNVGGSYQDSTDRSGNFHFQVPPGNYMLSLVSLPFTSPPGQVLTVVAKKPLTVPDQILKGAFQVGGTVVVSGTRDSIAGATVTAVSKTNVSESYTRLTDTEGHFNFGLKSGSYSIDASYLGKSLPAPISITVSKSMELPTLALPVTTALRAIKGKGPGAGRASAIPGLSGYDAKGARAVQPRSHRKWLQR